MVAQKARNRPVVPAIPLNCWNAPGSLQYCRNHAISIFTSRRTTGTDSESDRVGAWNSSGGDNNTEQDQSEDGEDLGEGEPELGFSVVLDTHEIESADSCNG